jgi:hypothetical protein
MYDLINKEVAIQCISDNIPFTVYGLVVKTKLRFFYDNHDNEIPLYNWVLLKKPYIIVNPFSTRTLYLYNDILRIIRDDNTKPLTHFMRAAFYLNTYSISNARTNIPFTLLRENVSLVSINKKSISRLFGSNHLLWPPEIFATVLGCVTFERREKTIHSVFSNRMVGYVRREPQYIQDLLGGM